MGMCEQVIFSTSRTVRGYGMRTRTVRVFGNTN